MSADLIALMENQIVRPTAIAQAEALMREAMAIVREVTATTTAKEVTTVLRLATTHVRTILPHLLMKVRAELIRLPLLVRASRVR